MKKNLRSLEVVSASALMLSKYFLALGSVYGWWLSVVGYALTAIFNYKIKLRIAVVVISGLCLLSIYGLYKWSNSIVGLQLVDYIVISISTILASVLIYTESKAKRPFWILQTNTTITFTTAFILLGLKIDIGWYFLLLGHANNTFLYYKKEAYFIGAMQIASIIIILNKLF